MDLKALGQEVLSLVEAEGPMVVGALLELVAPGLPATAIAGLVASVERIVTAQSEKEQMQAAVASVEAADETATKLL